MSGDTEQHQLTVSMIHGLQDGHKIGLRGPVPTFTLDPGAYDRVIMASPVLFMHIGPRQQQR